MEQLSGFVIDSYWNEVATNGQVVLTVKSNDEVIVLKFTNEKFTLFVAEDAQVDNAKIDSFKNVNLKAFNQTKVKALYTKTQSQFLELKEYLTQNSIRSYENDIWPNDRFLMERFIYGDIAIVGESSIEDGYKTFINPKILPLEKSNFRISDLSFDIETGVKGEVYSIGVHYNGLNTFNHVYMLTDSFTEKSDDVSFYFNEKELIQAFLKDFHRIDPDIIIGWHVVGFDIKFLIERSFKLGLDFELSRFKKKSNFREAKGIGAYIDIPGRSIIDGPKAMKAMFLNFDNLKLETVASSVLNTSKDIASDAGKVSEIERRFKEDKMALAKYNLLDCTLVKNIYNKLNVFEFYIEKTRNSGLLFNKSGISTLEFDYSYLPKLHRKSYVAQNSSDFEREDHSTGGYVIEPVAGLHQNVGVFDFKSLYPSIIRTFKIDPLSLTESATNGLRIPSGHKFSQTEFILPQIIEKLLIKREQAKAEGNLPTSMAIKILMNSFYGVMGTPKSRFYHADLPSAITLTGQWIIKTVVEFLNNRDISVLYGDTDSIFLDMGTSSFTEPELCIEINDFLKTLLQTEYKIESHLQLEHEITFDKLFFGKTRDGLSGAKKKYVGMKDSKLSFKGMEFVRSDWTNLAKNFQYELFENFFSDYNLESFIKDYVDKLKLGRFDNDLVYTKRLTKSIDAYTKNVPVHVKAAKMIDHTGPYRLKEVSYVMTPNGAIPVNLSPEKFDYEHYIEKQIKPLADQVLSHFGKDYDSIFTGEQLGFF